MDRGDAVTDARLDPLRARIDRLIVDPSAIEAPFVRLARPVLKRLGWQPTVRTDAVQALMDWVRLLPRMRADIDVTALQKSLDAAIRELDQNVLAVERACVVNRRPSVAHVAWLTRLHEVVARIDQACANLQDDVSIRLAGAIDPVRLLPPLTVRAGEEAEPSQPDDQTNGGDLVAVQLGSVDHLLAAARDESEVLGRRRHLLEGARQVLLESAAAMPLDAEGVEARRRHIASEISWLDRLQAAGVDPEVALTHQAQQAIARHDPQRLHAVLQAIDHAASTSDDRSMAALSARALEAMWQGRQSRDPAVVRASRLRSATEIMGKTVVAAVEAAYKAGRQRYAAGRSKTDEQRDFQPIAAQYLEAGNEFATLSALANVDGCCEVGGALAPVRIVEQERVAKVVRHPTADMVLATARDIGDVPDAVIEDPRALLVHLAEGKLLARRFVKEETRPHARTVLRGEVRVYVLDGSGSMIGPRARMRDAIMVAELATVAMRIENAALAGRVVLYYRYFNTKIEPVRRVDGADNARKAIDDVLGVVRHGGTNIEGALVASFQTIRDARADDPDLARAQIVLVTDGEAPIRPELIEQARAAAGEIPIGLSVIALGEENPALRNLVATQRARGSRAFYHFLPDAALASMVTPEDQGPAIHLPDDLVATFSGTKGQQLQTTVGGLVEEIASLGKARDVDALEALDAESRARREMGLDEASVLSHGERARAEALRRDRRALEQRYARWFPERDVPTSQPEPISDEHDAEQVDSIKVALSTVQEVVSLLGGSELSRHADAIELLERLLSDARLTPARYASLIERYGAHVATALVAVHEAVRDPAERH